MALSQVYTAVIGHVITAARWNNEFGNIYANGTDLAFPLTKNVSLAGFTLTLDVAGATTLLSSASQGFVLTPGTKSGTPGLNGSLLNLIGSTFTDTNTGVSGTASVWNGTTLRAPTLAASNLTVTTTNASTLHVEAGPTSGTNETITNAWAVSTGGNVLVAKEDTRTNTVATPLTVQALTSGTPANSIGTGILLQAESADETPSNVGQIDFTFSDRAAGSEDSFFQILLRVAGAALVAAYQFVSTSTSRAIFTHANTGDRTYTLPNNDLVIGNADFYKGPSSTGASSAIAHEGTVTISASQALSGVHYYTDFTLDAGDTLTVDDAAGRLVIFATGIITINGSIDGVGAGAEGGAGGAFTNENGRVGGPGTTQGGGGGGGAVNGFGGDGGSTSGNRGGRGGIAGTAGTQAPSQTGFITGLAHPLGIYGGGGGGGGAADGAGNDGGAGGNGGASVVLVAPNVVFGAAATINTSGGAGGNGTTAGGGGGGGSAGNVYVFCRSYTNNGVTLTMTGGAAGTGAGAGANGAAGRDGVRQINIYA